MKSTLTDQEIIDASAPAMRGERHGMRPEHFAQPMLDSMRAIADAAVARVMAEGKVPHAAGFKPKYETLLRDEFAGRALIGAMSRGWRNPSEVAKEAFAAADAMMEARNENR